MADKHTGIQETLQRWRWEIKNKERRIISFEETVRLKIDALYPLIFPEQVPLEGWSCREFIYTRHRERQFKGDWRPIKEGETWGGPNKSALFKTTVRIPKAFAGKKVVLKLYLGGDGLLYIDGVPYHGLDPFRDTVVLTERAEGTEVYKLEAESYIFWHFGESEVKTIEISQLAAMDQEMNDTYWDFRAVYNVMTVPDQNPLVVSFLKDVLETCIWAIDQNENDPAILRAQAVQAREILRREVYESDRFKQSGLLHLAGNSHLDVVFLWTHAEFVRKLGRTHATTLRLMEQYPDYTFSQSQPLMYQEMKENYPALYEQVKQRIQEGRWEVIGAFWVEPDCNLVSGESFVRQILYGMAFIEQEFGVTPRTCWTPDVFGNAWTMPQILQQSGLDYFVTHKMITWNDTNPWTKHTFWWQGPDGSRVLAVIPPTHFIGSLDPDHLTENWQNFSHKDTIGESLYNYGWGDGGGGPDAEMLEYMKRYRSFPGLPQTQPNTIEGALDSIARQAETAGDELSVVNDELYLEEHRGVHTTKAWLKKLNRRCEFLYRNAELWSCFTSLPYPREELEAGWKEVLNNQFHDSLPGSHIHEVYLDLRESYDRALGLGTDLLHRALDEIAGRCDTRGDGKAVLIFNGRESRPHTLVSLMIEERDIHILDPGGNEVPHQFVTDHKNCHPSLVFPATDLEPFSITAYRLVKGRGSTGFDAPRVSEHEMETDRLIVRLNDEGELVSLYSKTLNRECIRDGGRGNHLHLYEDVPGKYDAWDIASTYTKREFPLPKPELRVVEEGPVRVAVEVRRSFGQSRLVQRIVLTQGSDRVDFETWVDWHEQHKLLKCRFDTPLITRTATYDIAYGTIERSAYRGNSVDEARFEVNAHLWMDLSQPDRGVSLINDCKYGHEAFDGMMALSLLRAPTNPDPLSDQEEHTFTYSIYPHSGSWREGGTLTTALDLNDPVQVVLADPHDGELSLPHRVLDFDGEGVTVEAVKRAEQDDALIVRLVERFGRNCPVRLSPLHPLRAAWSVNLLERESKPVPVEDNSVAFELTPYKIKTLRLEREGLEKQ